MEDEGAHDEFLSAFEWEKFDMATVTQETVDRISKPIGDFLLDHTTKEVLNAAMTRNISICPLFSMKDILNDSNLKSRGFWCELEGPGINGKMRIPYPSRYVRSSENDTATRFRAPRIGEHNESVYSGIGLSVDDLAGLKERGII